MSATLAANKLPAPAEEATKTAKTLTYKHTLTVAEPASVSGQTANNKKHTAKHSNSSRNSNNNSSRNRNNNNNNWRSNSNRQAAAAAAGKVILIKTYGNVCE